MKFKDLLDEDGQGTRELDAWLAENIEGADIEKGIGGCGYIYDTVGQIDEPIPYYTTRDSIDPIWELAKEYFHKPPSLKSHLNVDNPNTFTCGAWHYGSYIESWAYETEQLAISEALFKAYQKENE